MENLKKSTVNKNRLECSGPVSTKSNSRFQFFSLQTFSISQIGLWPKNSGSEAFEVPVHIKYPAPALALALPLDLALALALSFGYSSLTIVQCHRILPILFFSFILSRQCFLAFLLFLLRFIWLFAQRGQPLIFFWKLSIYELFLTFSTTLPSWHNRLGDPIAVFAQTSAGFPAHLCEQTSPNCAGNWRRISNWFLKGEVAF